MLSKLKTRIDKTVKPLLTNLPIQRKKQIADETRRASAAAAIQASKQHNSQNSNLLNLPQELIDYIADFLHPVNKAVLAITCCLLYIRLRSRLSDPSLRRPKEIKAAAQIIRKDQPSPYVLLRHLENDTWRYCDKCFTLHPRGEFAKLKRQDRAGGGKLKPYCRTPGIVYPCPGWSISYREARRLVQQLRSSYVPSGCNLKGLNGEKGGRDDWPPKDYVLWKEYQLPEPRKVPLNYRSVHQNGNPFETVEMFLNIAVRLHRGCLYFAFRYHPRAWQIKEEYMKYLVDAGVTKDKCIWVWWKHEFKYRLRGYWNPNCSQTFSAESFLPGDGVHTRLIIFMNVGRIRRKPDRVWKTEEAQEKTAKWDFV